ncbi:hypothetical protein LXL04_016147 [Taraxacum kok-saghyz]
MQKIKKKLHICKNFKKNCFFGIFFFATGLVFERFLASRSRLVEKVNGLGVLGAKAWGTRGWARHVLRLISISCFLPTISFTFFVFHIHRSIPYLISFLLGILISSFLHFDLNSFIFCDYYILYFLTLYYRLLPHPSSFLSSSLLFLPLHLHLLTPHHVHLHLVLPPFQHPLLL